MAVVNFLFSFLTHSTLFANDAKVSSFSAGLVGLTKRQKRQQPDALIKVFKFLLLKSKIPSRIGFPVIINFSVGKKRSISSYATPDF